MRVLLAAIAIIAGCTSTPSTPPVVSEPTPAPSPSPEPTPTPGPTATPKPVANCMAPTPPKLTADERGPVKFYPGHYVAIGVSAGAYLTETLKEIGPVSQVVGVQKRYAWSDLQTGQDAYNFTQLKTDIEAVKKAGKKLSVMLMWKFDNASGGSPVPSYLDAMTGKKHQYALGGEGKGPAAKGFIAMMDNPIVVSELVRFLAKLSEVIDNDPTVANFVFAETAMGIDFKSNFEPDLTSAQELAVKNAFIDGVLLMTKRASCIFKATPIVQLTNGPINRLPELTKAYSEWTIGMGGPDVWIKDDSLERPTATWPKRAYDYYPDLEAKLPIGLIIAGGNYLYPEHHPETLSDPAERAKLTHEALSGWDTNRTITELGKKAVNQLSANYIWWKRNGLKGDKYYLAFLEQVKAGTLPSPKTECPLNYRCK